jgi:hypothetical protein
MNSIVYKICRYFLKPWLSTRKRLWISYFTQFFLYPTLLKIEKSFNCSNIQNMKELTKKQTQFNHFIIVVKHKYFNSWIYSDMKNVINPYINNKWHSRWLNLNTKLNQIKKTIYQPMEYNPEHSRKEEVIINRLQIRHKHITHDLSMS